MNDRFDHEQLQHARHAPAILGVVTGCAAYVGAHRLHRPVAYYLPEIGQWSIEAPRELIAMSYFGLIPLGLAGFALGWALAKVPAIGGWLATRRARTLTLAATTAIAGALLYHVAVELSGHMGR